MIKIYLTSRTKSGRLAVQWLQEYNLKYVQRNISKRNSLEAVEIKEILSLTENGFDDLINKRSKMFKELRYNIYDYTTEELIRTIIENPTIIKLPIIVNEKNIVIGYNREEIRCFLPKEYRKIFWVMIFRAEHKNRGILYENKESGFWNSDVQ